MVQLLLRSVPSLRVKMFSVSLIEPKTTPVVLTYLPHLSAPNQKVGLSVWIAHSRTFLANSLSGCLRHIALKTGGGRLAALVIEP